MHTQTIELPSRAEGPVDGVRIEFGSTRTRITGVEVVCGGRSVSQLELEPSRVSNDTTVDLSFPSCEAHSPVAHVSFEGALPTIEFVQWREAEGAAANHFGPAMTLAAITLTASGKPGPQQRKPIGKGKGKDGSGGDERPLDRPRDDPDDTDRPRDDSPIDPDEAEPPPEGGTRAQQERRLKRLEETLAIQQPGKARARRFFFDIDYYTLPKMVESDPRLSPGEARARARRIEKLRQSLQDQVERKARRFEKDKFNGFSDPIPDIRFDDLETLQRVSTIIIDAARKSFSDDGQLDYALVENAFEKFAGARLRDIGANGSRNDYAPDSGYYFSFVELAFLAIQKGVDTGFWTKILNVLVASLEIFLRAYPPPTVPGFRQIVARHADGPKTRSIPERTMIEVRARYVNRDVENLKKASVFLAFFALARGKFTDNDIEELRGVIGAN